MPGMDRIKVEIPELREAISKFDNCKGQFAAAYSQMATEVMALNSSWNGAASEAFVNSFSDLLVNLRTSDPTIEQAVAGLRTAVEEYEKAEQAASNLLRGMTEASSPF